MRDASGVGRSSPVPLPSTIVVLGASGDLARKKTYPALFSLFLAGHIRRSARVIGYARTALTKQEFVERIRPALVKLWEVHQLVVSSSGSASGSGSGGSGGNTDTTNTANTGNTANTANTANTGNTVPANTGNVDLLSVFLNDVCEYVGEGGYELPHEGFDRLRMAVEAAEQRLVDSLGGRTLF